MKLEVSPSGRAGCRGCKKPIPKGEVRFAESFTMPGSDQESYRYWHLPCAAAKLGTELKAAMDAYEGDLPERAAIELAIANAPKKTGKDRPLPHADRAPTSRAKCIQCGEGIEKASLRVGVQREAEPGAAFARGPSYLHPACALPYVRDAEPDTDLEAWKAKMIANADLPEPETTELLAAVGAALL